MTGKVERTLQDPSHREMVIAAAPAITQANPAVHQKVNRQSIVRFRQALRPAFRRLEHKTSDDVVVVSELLGAATMSVGDSL